MAARLKFCPLCKVSATKGYFPERYCGSEKLNTINVLEEKMVKIKFISELRDPADFLILLSHASQC